MGYKNAVVLLNMGGPNSLDEVSSFLKNMFADPCILSVPSSLLRSMLGAVIVNSRVEKSKKIYEKLGGGSPLTAITFSLTQSLQAKNPDTFYTYAMRYTPPFCYEVLGEIKALGIDDVTLFSMYPQYSTTTTLSSFNDALSALKKLDFHPNINIIERYHDHKLYIDSIANSIEARLDGADAKEFSLILSAHSIPVSRVKKGDPYEDECEKGCECIKEELAARGIVFGNVCLSYQSKLGPVKWLEPSTESTIKKEAPNNLLIYPLSFTIDNSETRYELSMQNRELADSLGVKDYRVCDCLNHNPDFVNLILELTKA